MDDAALQADIASLQEQLAEADAFLDAASATPDLLDRRVEGAVAAQSGRDRVRAWGPLALSDAEREIADAHGIDVEGMRARLLDVWGIGPVLSERIVRARLRGDPLRTLDDVFDAQGRRWTATDDALAASRDLSEMHNHERGVYTVEDLAELTSTHPDPNVRERELYDLLVGMALLQARRVAGPRWVNVRQQVQELRADNAERQFMDPILQRLDGEGLGRVTQPLRGEMGWSGPLRTPLPPNASPQQVRRALEAVLTTSPQGLPFDRVYAVRRMLWRLASPDPRAQAEILLRRLRSQGLDYVELQGGPPAGMTAAEFRRLFDQENVEVRFLHQVSSRGLLREDQDPVRVVQDAVEQMFVPDADGLVVGVDFLGPEPHFTDRTHQAIVGGLRYMEARLQTRGGGGVFRIHAGEGYFGDVSDADLHSRRQTYQQNLDVVIGAVEAFQLQRAAAAPIEIRIGHATQASPRQIERLTGLGVHFELNLRSNIETRAGPNPEELDTHPMLAMMYYGSKVTLSTDGGGLVRSTLAALNTRWQNPSSNSTNAVGCSS